MGYLHAMRAVVMPVPQHIISEIIAPVTTEPGTGSAVNAASYLRFCCRTGFYPYHLCWT